MFHKRMNIKRRYDYLTIQCDHSLVTNHQERSWLSDAKPSRSWIARP